MADAVVRALQETWHAMSALLRDLGPGEWLGPTPCEGWSVRDLMSHVAAGQSAYEEMPVPEVPSGWTTDKEGIEFFTAMQVDTRAGWSTDQILEEFETAIGTQIERLSSLDEAGWEAPVAGLVPPGIKTTRDLARNRLLDGYVHLLDLRVALGKPLDLDAQPTALAEAFQQALDFAGWGAVKKAGVAGGRIRLDLTEPCAHRSDLVVEHGRGRIDVPEGDPADRVVGTGAALLLSATGRRDWLDAAGGIKTLGPLAEQFLDGYVIWA